MEDGQRYRRELLAAKNAAMGAGSIAISYYRQGVRTQMKDNGTPVTIADQEANALITQYLARAFPEDSIISEEDADLVRQGRRQWYVDPIDGTKSFIRGIGTFAVHVGLADEGVPVLGVVYQPIGGRMYWGVDGVGAFKEEPVGSDLVSVPMCVDRNAIPRFAAVGYSQPSDARYMAMMHDLGLHRYITTGSEGLRAMAIAQGNADIRISDVPNRAHTWDLCAPHAILRAAGGYLSSLAGDVDYHGQREIGSPHVMAASEESLRQGLDALVKYASFAKGQELQVSH
ncbi:MAG: 3'(2'),5'-bisphosphate nucleotidase CysQ [Nanoarchaeota archaeon]